MSNILSSRVEGVFWLAFAHSIEEATKRFRQWTMIPRERLFRDWLFLERSFGISGLAFGSRSTTSLIHPSHDPIMPPT
jgi:hypothetical protein